MSNKVTVTGWQPISEYDRKVRPWVVVKCYDKENDCFYTDYAVMLSNGEWYGTDTKLFFEPTFFFNVDQIAFDIE